MDTPLLTASPGAEFAGSFTNISIALMHTFIALLELLRLLAFIEASAAARIRSNSFTNVSVAF